MLELYDIFLPVRMSIDLFFPRPGRFDSSSFYFGAFVSSLINVPYFLVDPSERPSFDTSLCRADSTAQSGTHAKRVDGCSSIQEISDFPFVEVTASKDTHIGQSRLVKLFTHIDAVSNNITAIEAHGCERMSECFLRAQGDTNGYIDCLTRIVGVEQKSVAIVSCSDGFESF